MARESTARKEISELLPLSEVDFLILLILSQGESHGYGLVKEIVRRTEGKTRPLPGNLYAVLRRLMREDLIVESDAPPDGVSEDGRRRYYRITDFGLDIAAAEAQRMKSLLRTAEKLDLLGSPTR